MLSFLADVTDNTNATYTVVVLDETGRAQPRQYQVKPRQIRYALWGLIFAVVVFMALLFIFTPVLELVPGRSITDIREGALRNAQMLDRMEDSLAVQQQYIEHLQRLLTVPGDVEFDVEQPAEVAAVPPAEEVLDEPQSEDWEDHEQPALPLESMAAENAPAAFAVQVSQDAAVRGYLSSLRLPVLPPVDGFTTRGFSARSAHYAVDLAVPEGTWVRSIGDGYVIFADWTNDGGYTIVVQHAEGYVSVYKHNKSLRKRVGDRVRDREAIAISGNSGEITTGPHVHFELWHEGLAQDPQQYFIQ